MCKDNRCLIKQLVICLFLAILIVSPSVLARRSQDDSPERSSRENEKELLKEQKRQEAIQSFPELDNALKEILQSVSKNQRPQPEVIDRAAGLLEKNKRNGSVYDDQEKAQFMLLQAWTGYYQDNLVDAVRWSMRACKTNEASQDAWISQALFSMVMGRNPMLPRMDAPKPRPRRPRNSNRRRDEASPAIEVKTTAKPFSEKGELEFDLLGLRTEMFSGQFSHLKCQAVDGSEIEHVSGKDTLCILFWQEEEISDANDISPKKENNQRLVEQSMGSDSQETTLQSQRDYMRMLKDACQEKPVIKFAQINTNKPDVAAKALEKAVQDPHIEEAGPLIFAAVPDSKAQQFMAFKADKPFMMIIDTEGKVKYAGTAAGFVPAFILTQSTGIELDLEKMDQSQKSHQLEMQPGMQIPSQRKMQTRKQPQPLPGMMPLDIPMPAVDPNKPSADPNTPPKAKRPVTPPVSKQSYDFPTQSLEDQMRAEKLLQSAQMHIDESRKLHMKNPKQGIEDARKVIEQYPNTQYAQQARELLRRVPDRWKKQHNITDEELGY